MIDKRKEEKFVLVKDYVDMLKQTLRSGGK